MIGARQTTWNGCGEFTGLRFVAVDPCVVSLQRGGALSVEPPQIALLYSTNDAKTWRNFIPGETSVQLAPAEEMCVKAKTQISGFAASGAEPYETGYWHFKSGGGRFDLRGQLVSLTSNSCRDTGPIGGGAFNSLFSESDVRSISALEMPENGKTAAGEKHTYKWMFADCSSLEDTPVFKQKVLADQNYYSMFSNCVSLKRLSPLNYLSASGNSACMQMFMGCTALEEVPDGFMDAHLGTRPHHWEMHQMFGNCVSLKRVPENLLSWCTAKDISQIVAPFAVMFNRCSSLVAAPELPACETLGTRTFNLMFNCCYSLSAAPAVKAKTLGSQSCELMFNSCCSLSAMPDMSFERLAPSCCQQMFGYCTDLTGVSDFLSACSPQLCSACFQGMFKTTGISAVPHGLLSAFTELAPNCYREMFYSCPALTAAPMLPAQRLAPGAYNGMFRNSALAKLPDRMPSALTLSGDEMSRFAEDCPLSGYEDGKLPRMKLSVLSTATSALYRVFHGTQLTDASQLSIEAPDGLMPCMAGAEMFRSSRQLSSPPAVFPGVSCGPSAYLGAFQHCVRLSGAPAICCEHFVDDTAPSSYSPELPAQFMYTFYSTRLSGVEVRFSDWNGGRSTKDWFFNMPYDCTLSAPAALLSSMPERSATYAPANFTLCAVD